MNRFDTNASARSSSAPKIEWTAWWSVAINVFLMLLNLIIAWFSGSLAVTAEAVHNLVDLLSALALMVGLRLSQRQSKNFPYGLYKVENLVAIVMALLIFFSAYELLKGALFLPPRELVIHPLMLGGILISMLLPLAFSRYEMCVGREANSPSLMADAQEYRAHVFSSGVVLLALLGQMVGFPLDRWAAPLVILFIGRTGWELLVNSLRVLLDASLEVETLGTVRRILEEEPLLVAVSALTGRNAGRFRFIEAEVTFRTQDLAKAHRASERLENAIKREVSHVDRVLIHYEPARRTHVRCAVPLQSLAGRLSEHFGEAPYFALLTIRTADGGLEHQQVHANPFLGIAKAKGIRVAEWLVAHKADVVLTREPLNGKGPGYVLGNAGVERRPTAAGTLEEVLTEFGPNKARPSS